jgi:uncharacterized membrane protein
VKKTVIAEYEVPGKLTPIELGMLMTNGRFKNNFVTADIINLAVKGILTIKEVNEKILFFNSQDYEFTKNPDPLAVKGLVQTQKDILNKLFGSGNTVKLSSLKNNFYKVIGEVEKDGKSALKSKGLISPSGLYFNKGFLAAGGAMIFLSFFFAEFSIYLTLALIASGLITLIFAFAMPKRTPAGAELNWKIKGFKLFMETVDKHRAEFYEKENIFEKFLPYAIVFGITGLWIKKMKEIYGENYYATHMPLWYVGSLASFDADSFASRLESLSGSIAANTSAPSGSGGSGSSGGGGGGGGGGGW